LKFSCYLNNHLRNSLFIFSFSSNSSSLLRIDSLQLSSNAFKKSLGILHKTEYEIINPIIEKIINAISPLLIYYSLPFQRNRTLFAFIYEGRNHILPLCENLPLSNRIHSYSLPI
jgi:hypothetical protein